MNKRFSPDQMLHQIGGWYLTILVAFAQIVSLLGIIPGILSVQTNAEFSDPVVTRRLSFWISFLIVFTIPILVWISRRLTPTALKKLDYFADDTIRLKSEDEITAWREITSLSWRYGI